MIFINATLDPAVLETIWFADGAMATECQGMAGN